MTDLPAGGDNVTWDEADSLVSDSLKRADSVALITRSLLGPSERALIEAFLMAKPGARHFVHEAVHDGPRRDAWRQIHGRDGAIRPRLDRAKIILSLDSDFLGSDGDVLGASAAFAATRDLAREPSRSRAGRALEALCHRVGHDRHREQRADHRIPLKPSLFPDLTANLAEGRGHGR